MKEILKRLYNEGYEINIFQYLKNSSELIMLEKNKTPIYSDYKDKINFLALTHEYIINKLINTLLFSGQFELKEYTINEESKTINIVFKNLYF